MWGEIIKLGTPAAIAVVLTVAGVVWVKPAGTGGIFLIFIVCLAFAFLAMKIIGWFFGNK
ncbi:hypothetical protein ELG66_00990 [Rhizobium leguminosarum]|nr:hypothetical protein ELG66_00990 [Rhizobium leguminosarum]